MFKSEIRHNPLRKLYQHTSLLLSSSQMSVFLHGAWELWGIVFNKTPASGQDRRSYTITIRFNDIRSYPPKFPVSSQYWDTYTSRRPTDSCNPHHQPSTQSKRKTEGRAKTWRTSTQGQILGTCVSFPYCTKWWLLLSICCSDGIPYGLAELKVDIANYDWMLPDKRKF